MRKLTSLIASLVMAFAWILPMGIGVTNAKADGADTERTKLIDMYLIGGQSNASGNSKNEGLNGRFENVGYAGAVEYSLSAGGFGSNTAQSYSKFKWAVTAGLGKSSGYIGPEYGIAQEINDNYAGGRKAFIYKGASGGTPLRDIEHAGGNWYPRSLWEEGYSPRIGGTDPTGMQYYIFIENFKTVYTELKANGYTPVVQGMAWMQGCADLWNHDEYEGILKTMITDIRTDLTEITGTDQSEMPFIIGKIATSFSKHNNPAVPAFNTMQERVASTMTNVETVETSDLIIVNEDGSINGTDIYHFNCEDAVTLGQRFGEKLIAYAQPNVVTVTSAENGTVAYEYDADGKLWFSFPANEHYSFQSATLNGNDVTSLLTDGKYCFENAPAEIEASATFVENEKFSITYDDLTAYGGTYKSSPSYCYEGDTLKVRINLPEGYEILSVKVGETEMTYNTKTKNYEAVPTGDGRVQVEVKTLATDDSSESASESSTPDGSASDTVTLDPESGCGSTIEYSAVVLCLALVVGAFVILKKHRAK